MYSHSTNRNFYLRGSNAVAIEAAKTVDLLELIEPTTTLVKVGAREYAGPCPKCGGNDRFRVHVGRGWFCRQCMGEPGSSGGHWNDAIDFIQWYEGLSFQDALRRLNGTTGGTTLTPEEIEARARERERREAAERAQEQAVQARARAALAEGGEWQDYHSALTPEARTLWHKRGLTDSWINYYRLGFCAARRFSVGESQFISSSLTIPYWRADMQPDGTWKWKVTGLKHRILIDNPVHIKYLPDRADLGQQLFVTDPQTRSFWGRVLLVEGEIKAMVTWAALWGSTGNLLAPDLHVIGLPGKSARPQLLEELQAAERVYICLDPDVYRKPNAAARGWQPATEVLAAAIGREKSRIFRLPGKIDDLILAGALDAPRLIKIMEKLK